MIEVAPPRATKPAYPAAAEAGAGSGPAGWGTGTAALGETDGLGNDAVGLGLGAGAGFGETLATTAAAAIGVEVGSVAAHAAHLSLHVQEAPGAPGSYSCPAGEQGACPAPAPAAVPLSRAPSTEQGASWSWSSSQRGQQSPSASTGDAHEGYIDRSVPKTVSNPIECFVSFLNLWLVNRSPSPSPGGKASYGSFVACFSQDKLSQIEGKTTLKFVYTL
ncbi:Transient receptor potential cation channel subfamily M member 1 [Frankliniella fusca]|uniref:Transient receptor potential cation channel subfamily M member 1 n=1 Tax=Frankliniella fusca TaxID=407009 RepID=A0AAE1H114_9NEOP|nr:Transient receptor potential cation channel subfamily M member 1 [Frankliniella fusca]